MEKNNNTENTRHYSFSEWASSYKMNSPLENFREKYGTPINEKDSLINRINDTQNDSINRRLEEKPNTIVINIIGAPGCGKTTAASFLFYQMKSKGYEVELVSEYAKELVWEERNNTLTDEIYIFGKQQHRFHRLKGKVRFIITDRPICLSKFYNEKYGIKSEAFNTLVDETVAQYDNLNFFLKRGNFKYVNEGRNQTEEESKEFESDMFNIFKDDIQTIIYDEKQLALVINRIFHLRDYVTSNGEPTELGLKKMSEYDK